MKKVIIFALLVLFLTGCSEFEYILIALACPLLLPLVTESEDAK